MTVMLGVLYAASALAGEEEFDADKMLADLETQLKLSSDKLSELKPALDAKSAELKKSINESVEKGFMQLEALSGQLDAASKEAEKKLSEALNSEEMQQLREYLNNIDGQAMEEIRQQLVAELTEFLKLTEAQIQQLKPALEEAVDRLGKMLDELAREGQKSVEAFRRRYDQLSKELEQKIKDTLDSEQFESLHRHRDELKENIREAMYSA